MIYQTDRQEHIRTLSLFGSISTADCEDHRPRRPL